MSDPSTPDAVRVLLIALSGPTLVLARESSRIGDWMLNLVQGPFPLVGIFFIFSFVTTGVWLLYYYYIALCRVLMSIPLGGLREMGLCPAVVHPVLWGLGDAPAADRELTWASDHPVYDRQLDDGP
jgi:hypothetical protein